MRLSIISIYQILDDSLRQTYFSDDLIIVNRSYFTTHFIILYNLQTYRTMNAQQLARQIKNLLSNNDEESIKFLIMDQPLSKINQICSHLNNQQAAIIKNLKKAVQDQRQSQDLQLQDKAERNKKIDNHLKKKQSEKEMTFLQMMAKMNEKLVYEQHFGFPFYDLFKRIMQTHGDYHPNMQAIKAMHSQIQLFYSIIFGDDIMKYVRDNYKSWENGIQKYLATIFAQQLEQFNNFNSIYRKIKKQTQQDHQEKDSEYQEVLQVSPNEDNTLHLDQKQFLVQLSQKVNNEQFQQFVRNRSYNFLSFGLKKYQLFMDRPPNFFKEIDQKDICQKISFVSFRFVRKMIFTIVKQRNQGKLKALIQPMTAQQIKRVGNQLLDAINQKIQTFMIPVLSIQDEALSTFKKQFEPYSYKDFVPSKQITKSIQNSVETSQYIWQNCKDYKALWCQRIKVQRFIDGLWQKQKPQTDYIDFVQKKINQYKNDKGKVWKEYIMLKLGFNTQAQVSSRKRVKLDSFKD